MILYTLTTNRYPFGRFSHDPFVAVQKVLQRSFEDLPQDWSSASRSSRATTMPVRLDVQEDDTAFQVTADLPGLNESEVNVTFDDGLLTIQGEKKTERSESEKGTWHVIERFHGSFLRHVSLPTTIDVEKIEAKFDRGVLHVTLPKAPLEQASARKITIKAG